MGSKWLITNYNTNSKFQLNISKYSSLFIDDSTDYQKLISDLNEYFKPRTKIKEDIIIKEITDDYNEINNHTYYSILFSDQILNEEFQLKNKTFMRELIKKRLITNIETDGYLITINTLIQDLINETLSDMPVNYEKITVDLLLKLLTLNHNSNNVHEGLERKTYFQQNIELINFIKQYILDDLKLPTIIFYLFPESNLSPQNQKLMYKFLKELSEELYIFVITKSKIFIGDEFEGFNYLKSSNQLFDEDFFNDLEWNSPIDYTKEQLIKSLIYVYNKHVDLFGMNPLISNYKDADIILFESIDIYILIYIMNKLKYKFILDLDRDKISIPVYEYAMEIYENI